MTKQYVATSDHDAIRKLALGVSQLASHLVMAISTHVEGAPSVPAWEWMDMMHTMNGLVIRMDILATQYTEDSDL